MSHDIILLRHGLSTANRDQIVQGQDDYPLAEDGRRQAKLLAAYWLSRQVHFDWIISSPLLRARETAEIIAEMLRCQVHYDEIWKERNLGQAQGMDYETFRAGEGKTTLPSPYEPFFGTGESEWELFSRASKAVQRLVLSPPGAYLIVSHGAFLGATMRAILGLSPSPGRALPVRIRYENTGFVELHYEIKTSRWSILKLNATCHLGHEEDES